MTTASTTLISLMMERTTALADLPGSTDLTIFFANNNNNNDNNNISVTNKHLASISEFNEHIILPIQNGHQIEAKALCSAKISGNNNDILDLLYDEKDSIDKHDKAESDESIVMTTPSSSASDEFVEELIIDILSNDYSMDMDAVILTRIDDYTHSSSLLQEDVHFTLSKEFSCDLAQSKTKDEYEDKEYYDCDSAVKQAQQFIEYLNSSIKEAVSEEKDVTMNDIGINVKSIECDL